METSDAILGEAASLTNVSETIPAVRPTRAPSRVVRSGELARSLLIYSPQFNTIGGVETHLVRLSCFLAERNWRVTLVTTSGLLDETRVAELAAAGVEFIAPREKTLFVPRKSAWLTWLVVTRLRRQHWDVIYTNAQGNLFWLLRPLRRRGTRVVHHYHTAGDARDEATWGWPFVKWLRAVDEIVACSTATAQNLRRFIGASRNDESSCNNVRVIRYLSADVTPSQNFSPRVPHAKLRFGFVGRLMRGKGISMICRLSEDPDLAHIEWHVHGCGADYDAAHFTRFSNVRYHGPYRGGAELSSILAQLDALVLFSTFQEGQPISLIEGMAAGLPWIATDQGGTRELMWSPDNCRLIGSQCEFAEAKCAVLELAQSIRAGKTSSAAQRRAYEDNLAPATVGEHWMEFLGEEMSPAINGAWASRALMR